MVSEASPAKALRVVLADDHAAVREQVRRALESQGWEICAEGASAAEAVTLAQQHRPDVALLDIQMPGGGIAAAADIARTVPDTAVVMLTSSEDEEDLFASLRAGAQGYLLKSADPAAMGPALAAVVRGEATIPPALLARVLREFRTPARPKVIRRSASADKLSAREWEVMELLTDGLSTEEAARRLFISTTTVRVHVSTVLRKLRVKDRQSAFRLLGAHASERGTWTH
ncbi:MAG: Two component transcriptional regulator, CheY family [Friedmanniella sp.]|nr:Two component transcriptional regulator, CheY family [Friedmanniella sp.]